MHSHEDLIKEYLGEGAEALKEDEGRLLESLERVRALIEVKEEQIKKARKDGGAEDALRVLLLELEQKLLVKEDLERNLSAIRQALGREAN